MDTRAAHARWAPLLPLVELVHEIDRVHNLHALEDVRAHVTSIYERYGANSSPSVATLLSQAQRDTMAEVMHSLNGDEAANAWLVLKRRMKGTPEPDDRSTRTTRVGRSSTAKDARHAFDDVRDTCLMAIERMAMQPFIQSTHFA